MNCAVLRTTCDTTRRRVLLAPRQIHRRLHDESTVKISQLLRPHHGSLDVSSHTVTVQGIVRSVRKQKKVAFAAIGDGSTLKPLQAVLAPELAAGLSTGAAARLTGSWVPSPAKAEQSHELQTSEIKILGDHEHESYPLQKKYHSNDFLRTIPHLRLRTALNALLLRTRSQVIGNVHNFFSKQDFVNVHPPVITSSDCEGAGEVFTIAPAKIVASGESRERFFRETKFLTVSSQLHLEAFAASVGRVWTLAPTFRAEQSDTPRHLSEFYMLEAEEMFVQDLESIMQTVEALLKHLCTQLFASHLGSELIQAADMRRSANEDDSISGEDLSTRWQKMLQGVWPRITYTEAIERLRDAMDHENFEHEPTWDGGLQAEHEKWLASTVGGGGPVFVTHYPQKLKAFYMALSPAEKQPIDRKEATVAAFDLLVPDLCEIAGGSIREHRLETLQKQAAGGQMAQHLAWYLDLRRYGSAPHGGFGLGFDRLLCYFTGINSIREMVAFPRYYGRCDC